MPQMFALPFGQIRSFSGPGARTVLDTRPRLFGDPGQPTKVCQEVAVTVGLPRQLL